MNDNDNAPKLRRHPLAPERFFEGTRQKWAGLFTLIGLLIMVATSYGFLKDPAPFLQFFLSIGVTFILGASASSVMNSWKVQSVSASEIVHADEEQTLNQNVNEHIEEEYVEKTPRPKDLDDSSLD